MRQNLQMAEEEQSFHTDCHNLFQRNYPQEHWQI